MTRLFTLKKTHGNKATATSIYDGERQTKNSDG